MEVQSALIFPELTEERRKDLAKDVKKKGEGAKVAVRNIRRDANDAVQEAGEEGGEITEDELAELAEDQIQKLTDKIHRRRSTRPLRTRQRKV